MDLSKLKGMTPEGLLPTSLSGSTVNVGLPIQLADEDEDAPPTMFALSHWVLPRVPCIGERIVITALAWKAKVESVAWDNEGRAMVNLQQVRLGPRALQALERDGGEVAPLADEPPSDWLN